MRIAYQGVPGAYGEAAALRLKSSADVFPCPAFEDVFEAVDGQKATHGIVPIELVRGTHAPRAHRVVAARSVRTLPPTLHQAKPSRESHYIAKSSQKAFVRFLDVGEISALSRLDEVEVSGSVSTGEEHHVGVGVHSPLVMCLAGDDDVTTFGGRVLGAVEDDVHLSFHHDDRLSVGVPVHVEPTARREAAKVGGAIRRRVGGDG